MDGPSPSSSNFVQFSAKVSRTTQYWLDKSTPHVVYRWLALLALVAVYGLRTWYIKVQP